MVEVTNDEAEDHGNHASNHVLGRESAHASSTQCDHGEERAVVERQNGGRTDVALLTVLTSQGCVDNAVGVGDCTDDCQRAQTQQACFAEQNVQQHAQAKAQEEL